MKYRVLCTTLFLKRKKPYKSGDIIDESAFSGDSGQVKKAIESRLAGKYIREATDKDIEDYEAKLKGGEAPVVAEKPAEDTGNKGGDTGEAGKTSEDTGNQGGSTTEGGKSTEEGSGGDKGGETSSENTTDDLPRKEIMEELDKLGVKKYNKNAPTKELYELLLSKRKT